MPRLGALARVAVAELMFAYLFSRIPVVEVGRTLAHAAPAWIGLAVLATALMGLVLVSAPACASGA